MARFGWVYKVPVLQINNAHIEEQVKSSIMEATRRVKPSKKGFLVSKKSNVF